MDKATWSAWFDGATKATNPGERGIGGVLKGPAGERIEISENIGFGTNNEAEYAALIILFERFLCTALPVFLLTVIPIRQIPARFFNK